jgi:hypothetical protein
MNTRNKALPHDNLRDQQYRCVKLLPIPPEGALKALNSPIGREFIKFTFFTTLSNIVSSTFGIFFHTKTLTMNSTVATRVFWCNSFDNSKSFPTNDSAPYLYQHTEFIKALFQPCTGQLH